MPLDRAPAEVAPRTRFGLRGRLLLVLALLIIALLVPLGLLAFHLAGRSVQDAARAETDAVADLGASLLRQRLNPVMPLAADTNRQRCVPLLRALLAFPGVREILVTAGAGRHLRIGRSGLAPTEHQDAGLRRTLRGTPPPTRPCSAAGSPLLLAYRRIRLPPDRTLALRVAVSPEPLKRSILAPARRWLIILGVIDGILVLIFGAVYLSGRIVRPIRRLETASDRVGRGDFDHHVEVHGSDEIALLSRRFNDMVDALRSKDAELLAQLDELKQKQQELDQSWEVLLRSAKLASTGRLAAGVAHELGNPMSSILGYLELLQDPSLAKAEREAYVGRIRDEVQRMDRTIRDLLDTARPEGDEVVPVSLPAVIRRAAELARHQKRLRDVDIRLQLDPDLPRAAASARLRQVILNLLLNAGDAMQAKGEVVIAVTQQANQLLITVTDTGPGIPPEVRKDLFDPFFTTKAPGEGTGLGLAICQSILEASGGRIQLTDPQPDRGADFTITLPVWSEHDV